VRIKDSSGVQEQISDGSGMLALAEGALANSEVEVQSNSWRLPSGFTVGGLLRTKTLWLYGTVTVRVRVTYARTPVDVGPPWITVRTVGPDLQSPADMRGTTPWAYGWSLRHGLDAQLNTLAFDEATHTFSGTIPRVLHTAIAVGRSGYRSRVLDLPIQGEDEVELVAVLDPAWALTGRLSDETGTPVAGAQLQAYIVIEGPRNRLNPAREALAGSQWAVGTRTTPDGHAVVNLGGKVPLAMDGSFRVDLPSVGRVVLVAHAAGRPPLWHDLGVIDRDLSNIALRLPPSGGASGRIAFRAKDAELRHATMHLSDITDRSLQTSLRIDLDGDGSCADTWFVRDREYWIVITFIDAQGDQVTKDGLIRWDGRAVVEIDSLEGDLDAFRSR